MLKIKDDVDLEELSKKYNMVYCSNWNEPFEDDNYGWIVTHDEALRIRWRSDGVVKGEISLDVYFGKYEEAIETFYNLVNDGLVEKVGDNQ